MRKKQRAIEPGSLANNRNTVIKGVEVIKPHIRSTIAVVLGALTLLMIATDVAGADSTKECRDANVFRGAERQYWSQICSQREIDFEKQTISSQFLVSVLQDPKLIRHLPPTGLVLKNAYVKGPLHIRNSHVFRRLQFENSKFDSSIDLSGTVIDGGLAFFATEMTQGLTLNRTTIKGSLLIASRDDVGVPRNVPRGGMTIKEIRAFNLRVQGDVWIFQVTAADGLDFTYLSVEGGFALIASKVGPVYMGVSTINGQVVLVDCDFSGTQQRQALNLYAVRTNQSVFLNRSNIDGSASLNGGRIDRNLILLGTKLQHLDASSVTIDGALVVGWNNLKEPPYSRETIWEQGKLDTRTRAAGAALDLRFARIREISSPRSLKLWPKSIDLSNATFQSFTPNYYGNRDEDRSEVLREEFNDMADWFTAWLDLQVGDRFQSHPYQQAIAFLSNSGNAREAEELGYVSRRKEMLDDFKHGRLGHFVYLFFSYVLTGFGYQLWKSGIAALLFVLFGWYVFRRATFADHSLDRDSRFIYSLNLFLPAVSLDENLSKAKPLGWAAKYAIIHKFAGWIIGLFLVAAITGLTK